MHRRSEKALEDTLADAGTRRDETEPADGLDAPRRMALDGLARAFEAAAAGQDWFAVRTALRRVDDAVHAVWYAARVRDDGRR